MPRSDECSKWRRVSLEVKARIDAGSGWTCAMNDDETKASCVRREERMHVNEVHPQKREVSSDDESGEQSGEEEDDDEEDVDDESSSDEDEHEKQRSLSA